MDKPVNKSNVFNTALPAIGADLLAADITSLKSPGVFRIYVCIAVAGILTVDRTLAGATVSENLNAGTALVANAGYMFTVSVREAESYNLHYSATGANILKMQIDEAWS
jgi:hypothetical protein